MRDDDDGAALFVEALEEREDIFAGLGVEGSGRFVGKDDGGVGDDGPGDGDALFLSAGELVGLVVVAILEADDIEGVQSFVLGAAGAGVEEGKLHILEGAHPGQQIERLKDESDLAVSHRRLIVAGHLADIFAGEDVTAGGGAVEASQDVHQGALAGAGGAADGDHLALFNGQAHAIEGMDDVVAHDIGLHQICGPQHGVAHGSSFANGDVPSRQAGINVQGRASCRRRRRPVGRPATSSLRRSW